MLNPTNFPCLEHLDVAITVGARSLTEGSLCLPCYMLVTLKLKKIYKYTLFMVSLSTWPQIYECKRDAMVRFPLEEKYYSIFRSFATHHDVFTMSSKFGWKWTDVSQWEPNVLTLGSQVVFPALCRMQSETKKTQKNSKHFHSRSILWYNNK